VTFQTILLCIFLISACRTSRSDLVGWPSPIVFLGRPPTIYH